MIKIAVYKTQMPTKICNTNTKNSTINQSITIKYLYRCILLLICRCLCVYA